MYILISVDFNGCEAEKARAESPREIRTIYESYIKRCLYGFPDIQELKIIKDGATVSAFINWRR